jgi:hypothetical protein
MMDKVFLTVLIAAGVYFFIYVILKKIGLLDRIQSWINSHLR